MTSEVVSSVLDVAAAEELARLARTQGTSRSAIMRAALDAYLAQVAEAELGAGEALSLETEGAGPSQPDSERVLGDRLRDAIVETYDFVPVIAARGETGPVTASFSKDLLRAVDVLLQQPGIRQRTRSDFVRAAVHFTVQAIDRMQALNHPTWRAAVVSGRQRANFERQLALSEDIYAGARSLVQSLVASLQQERLDSALVQWSDYYQDALEIGSAVERELMLNVLKSSPVCRRVAWLARGSGFVPEDFVPEGGPGVSAELDLDMLELDEGLPIPPHIKARRLILREDS